MSWLRFARHDGVVRIMKSGVITFPGSNCDDDIRFVLEKVCESHVDRLWHKDSPSLADFDLIVLPGGFSYGDYLRCGAMASLSPIMAQVKRFAEAGGLVLGICNGFQILCESHLLPGALAVNSGLQFLCKDVGLETKSITSPWTRAFEAGDRVCFPIAHGDGRYVVSAEEHAEMQRNEQVLFTYVSNPNGSSFDIAGVCNREKNVFGLMPHPERSTDLRSKDGMKLWLSVLAALEAKRK